MRLYNKPFGIQKPCYRNSRTYPKIGKNVKICLSTLKMAQKRPFFVLFITFAISNQNKQSNSQNVAFQEYFK